MAKAQTTAETDAANQDGKETDTGLTTAGEGVLSPNAKIADFISAGFSEERTMKIGDPSKGDAVVAYAGEFIGPGADVQLNEAATRERSEGQKTIPTWCFHPLDINTLKPIYSVTHTIICPHDLNAKCMSLAALKQAHPNKRIQASFMWDGKIENRLGQPLNKYLSAHRLVNEDGTAFNPGGKAQQAATAAKTA